MSLQGLITNYREPQFNQPSKFTLQIPTKSYDCNCWNGKSYSDAMKIECTLNQGALFNDKYEYSVAGDVKIIDVDFENEKVCIDQILHILYPGKRPLKTCENIYKLLSKYGSLDQVVDKLQTDPKFKAEIDTKFKKISRIGTATLDDLISGWKDQKRLFFLKCLGLSKRKIERILGSCYSKFIEQLETYPFALYNLDLNICKKICQIYNIPFTADDIKVAEICRNLNSIESSQFVTKFKVDEYSRYKALFHKHNIINLSGYLAFRHTFEAEQRLAETFLTLASTKRNDGKFLTKALKDKEIKSMWQELTDDQQGAIKHILKNNLTCISGSAGSGKSYIIGMLALILESQGVKYQCCAYTGKAVSALKSKLRLFIRDKCKDRVATIHKLLCFLGVEQIAYNQSDLDDEDDLSLKDYGTSPVETRPEYLIIDEASMVTGKLLATLFQQGKFMTKLILVGDSAQLPPFGGWGQPFTLLLTLKIGKIVSLHENLRLDTTGLALNKLFTDVRNGTLSDQAYDKVWNEIGDINKCMELYQGLCTHGISPNDIKIIAFNNKTVELANKLCQKIINTKSQKIINTKSQKIIKSQNFNQGDLVINRSNNYQLNLMNGQEGMIVKTVKLPFCQRVAWLKGVDNLKCLCGCVCQVKMLICKFEDGLVNLYEKEGRVYWLDNEKPVNISLAYAITGHRSQGSEWKHVILYLDSRNIDRNFIYTAVTRSKSRVYVIAKSFTDFPFLVKKVATMPDNWLGDFLSKKYSTREAESFLNVFSQRESFANEFFKTYTFSDLNYKYIPELTNKDNQRYDGILECFINNKKFNIYLEYDGEQHFEGDSVQVARDRKKRDKIYEQGDNLIRFTLLDNDSEIPNFKEIIDKTIIVCQTYQVIFDILYDKKTFMVRVFDDENEFRYSIDEYLEGKF